MELKGIKIHITAYSVYIWLKSCKYLKLKHNFVLEALLIPPHVILIGSPGLMSATPQIEDYRSKIVSVNSKLKTLKKSYFFRIIMIKPPWSTAN